MNYHALFAAAGHRIVRAGLIGVGDFGASLLAQARHIPNLEFVLLCDRDRDRVDRAIRRIGLNGDEIAITSDYRDTGGPDFDVLVEATGSPTAAAANALQALASGRHVVNASKEADILIGPLLHRLARAKGLVYTTVDGDQPSLLIGLISWARVLGLKIVAAGKASEYDLVLEPGGGLDRHGTHYPAPELAALWDLDGREIADIVSARTDMAASRGVPTKTVPDFCEMGIVANATGLLPDRADLHAPVLRTREVADALQLVDHGGLLSRAGSIDLFNCLRRPEDASFAGGVFVVVECEDRRTWDLLRDKGHMVARNGRAAMLYNPQHLLGIEAPISILSAALLGLPTGAEAPRPHVDLVARAARDLAAGERLAITDTHHHEVAGLRPELVPARAIRDAAACPYYLAIDRRLTRDVPAGCLITNRMLEPVPAEAAALCALRRQQDAHFDLD